MIDEPLTTCPECGAHIRRVLFPAGVVFKGAGFYKTDHRDSVSAAASAKDEGKSTESANAETTAKSESKTSESKTSDSGKSSTTSTGDSKAPATTSAA